MPHASRWPRDSSTSAQGCQARRPCPARPLPSASRRCGQPGPGASVLVATMRTQNQPCLVQSPLITLKALNKAMVLGSCPVSYSLLPLRTGTHSWSKGIAEAASQSPFETPRQADAPGARCDTSDKVIRILTRMATPWGTMCGLGLCLAALSLARP